MVLAITAFCINYVRSEVILLYFKGDVNLTHRGAVGGRPSNSHLWRAGSFDKLPPFSDE
jgi:hypothetical protein